MRTLRWQGDSVVRYTYLGVGTFVATDYLEPQVKLDYATGAGANRYAGWDRFGRIVDLLWQNYAPESSSSSSGEPPGLVHLQYGYDRAGNRTHRADLVARFYDKPFDERYEYDGLHRLKKFHRGRLVEGDRVIESPTLQQGWRLDATGNWQNFTQHDASDPAQTLDQQRVANQVNEITQIARTVGPAWATPSYDRNGNMTVIPQPKDMTQTYQATWDAWNRPVKLEEPNGSGGWRPLAEYQYDGKTWRTRAKNYTAGSLTETRHTYFSSQWQSLEDRLGPSPSSAQPDRQFLWGLRYVDDLALRDRETKSSGALDERLYALQDANWNVVAVCDDDLPTGRLAFSAYGQPEQLSSAYVQHAENNLPWEFYFTGQRYDSSSGVHLFKRRYLSSTAHWLSRDPARQSQECVNAYEVLKERPTVYTDPDGAVPIIPGLPGVVGEQSFKRTLCWPTANSVISNAVLAGQMPPYTRSYVNRRIATIVKHEKGSERLRCRLNITRPDIVLMAGPPPGTGQVWEIKPLDWMGSGLLQLAGYIIGLKTCCVDAGLGNCGTGTFGYWVNTKNSYWCGRILGWACAGGVIGYIWTESQNEVNAKLATLTLAVGILVLPEFLATAAAAGGIVPAAGLP